MLKIKVFSDFACPFCYIGYGLLNKLREDGILYSLEWVPFELDPNAALEGSDLFEVYSKEYVLKSLDTLSNLGIGMGIEFNNKRNKYNTKRAHLAGFYAKEKDKYEDYSLAMFEAYFKDDKNIGQREVIDKIANSIGLDVDEMNSLVDSGKYDEIYKDSYIEAQKYKIQSVPTFIVNDESKITGIRDYQRFKEEFLNIQKNK